MIDVTWCPWGILVQDAAMLRTWCPVIGLVYASIFERMTYLVSEELSNVAGVVSSWSRTTVNLRLMEHDDPGRIQFPCVDSGAGGDAETL